MINPRKNNGCVHAWYCVCMDRNDALYRCPKCEARGDGAGHVWMFDPVTRKTFPMPAEGDRP